MVLPRIEHFEQGAGWIAAKVCAQFVDLIKHQHRVARAEPPQFLDQPPRHRTDVRPAVAADLRLIAQPAQADARELAAKRLGDRLAQAGLAHARRPKETEDRPATARVQFADCEVLDEPLFDFRQAIVIAVEDLLRLAQIDRLLGHHIPRQFGERLEISNDDRVIWALRRDDFEPL